MTSETLFRKEKWKCVLKTSQKNYEELWLLEEKVPGLIDFRVGCFWLILGLPLGYFDSLGKNTPLKQGGGKLNVISKDSPGN